MIAALADLHLGAGAGYGRVPGDRLADQRRSWLEACTVVCAEQPDLLIIAGDVFHRPRPTPSEMMVYRDGLDLLAAGNVPVVVIAGNHDVASLDTPTAVEVLGVGGGEIVRTPRVCRVGGHEVACLPWTPLGGLAAARGGGDRDQLRVDAAELLVDTASGLRAACTTATPLLALHWAVSGALTVTGQPTSLFREVVLPLTTLIQQGWSALVAGHVHRYQPLAGNGLYCGFYCGSLTTVDFSEAAAEHGVVLFEPGGERRLVRVADRRFVTIDLDEPLAWATLLGEHDVADAVVRVRYAASSADAAQIDQAQMRAALYQAGAHKVYAIQATVERPERIVSDTPIAGDDEPLEALDAWILAQHVPARLAVPMRAITERYLEDAG